MAVATFDTPKFSKALREAGVSEKHAEAEAVLLSEVFSFNFKDVVTKEDLRVENRGVEERVLSRLKEVEQRLDAKIDQAVAKLEARIESTVAPLRSDNILLKWMLGAVLTILISVAVRMFFFPAK